MEQRALVDSEQVITSYPRVNATGEVVFGQPSAGAAASATLDVTSALVGGVLEGWYITLTDAAGTSATFEIDLSEDGVTSGRTAVVPAAPTMLDIATALMNAINASALAMTASGADDPAVNRFTVAVTQDTEGVDGNTTITTGGGTSISFSGSFSGGIDDPAARVGSHSTPMPEAFSATGVSFDAISVATTAAAAKGATQITVASAAWRRGRRYVIKTTDGHSLEVTSRSTNTGTTLHLAEPLNVAVPSGSTVLGWALMRTLTAAETSLPGPGTIIFRATIDGTVYIWPESFRVVRRLLAPTLTPAKLTALYPNVRTMASRNDYTLEELLLAAWETRIMPWLAAQDYDEDDVVNAHALEKLHGIACLLQLSMLSTTLPPDVLTRLDTQWAAAAQETLARNDWWTQPQVETPTNRPESNPRPVMGMRLVR